MMRIQIRSYLFILCLLGPSFSRFVLPSYLDNILTVKCALHSLYLPDLMFLLTPVFYPRKERGVEKHRITMTGVIAVLYLITLFYSTVVGYELYNSLYPLYLLSVYIFILCVVYKYRISSNLERPFVWICFFVLVYLSVQQIAFGFGLISLGSAGRAKGVYNQIIRIDGTVGSSNATVLVLTAMVGICYDIFRTLGNKKLSYATLIMGGIAIFTTLSRGGIAVFMLACIIYYFRILRTNYEFKGNQKARVLSIYDLIAIVIIVGVFYFAFYDSIVSRTFSAGELGYSRITRIYGALDHWKNIGIAGFGCYYDISWFDDVLRSGIAKSWYYTGSPHNMYVVTLVQSGVIALGAFVALLFCISLFLLKKQRTSLSSYIVVAVFIIGFNVECFYYNISYYLVLVTYVLWIMRRDYDCSNYV